MGKPTADDPLGQRPDPTDFGEAMNAMIDARIANAMRGRTGNKFDGTSSQELLLELIARGFAVYLPKGQ